MKPGCENPSLDSHNLRFQSADRTEERQCARAFSLAMIVLSDKLWQSGAEAEERETEW